jgi:hypothetical protein
MGVSNNYDERKHKIHKAKEWAAQHKIEIIAGVAVIVTVGIGVIGWYNKELIFHSIRKFKTTLKPATSKTSPIITPAPIPSVVEQVATVSSTISTGTARTVCEHKRQEFVRTLPNGWKPSPTKIVEAAEKGIKLKECETLVKSCLVGSNVHYAHTSKVPVEFKNASLIAWVF